MPNIRFRFYGSDREGKSFSNDVINSVWQKGSIHSSKNQHLFRKDLCGAWIKRSQYGNTSSEYGWEIDHIKPIAIDGTDNLFNLQPLHWKNNRSKGDDWPKWDCSVKA